MSYYPVAPNTPRDKFTFEVRDMTNSHVLGTVESVSERGARQMGARRFNLPYAHVAVTKLAFDFVKVSVTDSLPAEEAETPEVEPIIRAANPSAAHRIHGAHGIILDSARIALALPENHTLDGEQLLIMAPGYGKVLIAGTEGVGIVSADDGDTVGLYALRYGVEYVRVNIPRSVLWESTTNELCDIADFVRVFGGRLDGNAARLRRFAQTGE